MTYCIALWGGLSKQELDDLQVIQNKAVRVVLRDPPRSSRNEMFERSGYMTVRQLVFYHTVLNVYKIKLHKEPEYLFSNLQRENIRNNIIIAKTDLTLTRNGFIFRGSEGWNSMPLDIRRLEKVGLFKRKVKEWILLNVKRF